METYQVQRTDGTSATAQALSFASSNEFAGVEILTWPSASVLWPSTNVDAQSSFNLTDVTKWVLLKPHAYPCVLRRACSLTLSCSMFSVQSGLIRVESIMLLGSSTSNEPEEFIFSTDNGDDWFYFEDDSSSVGSLNTKPYPFQISTISATETELLRLKFKQQPTRKVVHKGACRFNGIKTPAEPSSRASGTTRVHSPVTVQVTFDDSL